MLTQKEYENFLKQDPTSWSESEHKAIWEYHTAHLVTLTPEETAERNKIIEKIFRDLTK